MQADRFKLGQMMETFVFGNLGLVLLLIAVVGFGNLGLVLTLIAAFLFGNLGLVLLIVEAFVFFSVHSCVCSFRADTQVCPYDINMRVEGRQAGRWPLRCW